MNNTQQISPKPNLRKMFGSKILEMKALQSIRQLFRLDEIKGNNFVRISRQAELSKM